MWCAVASLGVFQQTCRAAQVPLAALPSGSIDDSDALMNWRMDEPPNVNSTGHLVFETVNSLLQRWPNTRMRNGETLVSLPNI